MNLTIFEIFQNQSQQLLWTAIAMLGLFIITWIVSIFLSNVSIVDIIWGLSFVLQASIYFSLNINTIKWTKIAYFVLILIHNLRLSIYLLIRNWNKGEDKRYSELFRKKFGKNYWWISFFQVFLLQGLISYSLGLIFYGFFIFDYEQTQNYNNLGIFIFGIIVMLFGTVYESIADIHLYLFKKDQENKGKVLKTGLFKLSKHPNYFGEFIFYLGSYIVNLSVLVYYTVYVPIIMYLLLNYVSGAPITEDFMKKSYSEEYLEYQATTSSFWPWCKLKDNRKEKELKNES